MLPAPVFAAALLISLLVVKPALAHFCLEEAAGVCLKFQRDVVAEPMGRWERSLRLGANERRAIQEKLRQVGRYDGAIDGVFGPATRRAIRGWQEETGRASTGYLDAEAVRTIIGERGRASEGHVATAGDALHGLGCVMEIDGEAASITFRRDGGAGATAVGVSLAVTWTHADERLCIFNRGEALRCLPLPISALFNDREELRSHLTGLC